MKEKRFHPDGNKPESVKLTRSGDGKGGGRKRKRGFRKTWSLILAWVLVICCTLPASARETGQDRQDRTEMQVGTAGQNGTKLHGGTAAQTGTAQPSGAALQTGTKRLDSDKPVDIEAFIDEKTYDDVLGEYEQQGRTAAVGAGAIELGPEEAKTGGVRILKEDLEGRPGSAILSDKDNSYVEWEFTVKQEGLYEIHIDYLTDGGNGGKIQRRLKLDGKVPFQEANNISFYRRFAEVSEVTVNNIGDEVWPANDEVILWQTAAFIDNKGYYGAPFQFYFSEGSHTLRLEYVDQPFFIGGLTVKEPEKLKTYEEVKLAYERSGYREAAQTIKLQAEDTAFKNVSTIRRESSNDPKCQPSSPSNRLLNIIGGSRWTEGNQSISWNIHVDEAGLYKINFRGQQNGSEGMPSYRQIAIDGEIPFQEMAEYAFPFQEGWSLFTIQDENQNPYLFYFDEGDHVLTMTVKLGRIRDVIIRTTDDIQYLSAVVRELTKITGSDPDVNYEYNLYRAMPELSDELTYVADRLEVSADIFKEISNMTTSMETNYREIVDKLRYFAEDTDRVIKNFSDLTEFQTNLGTWLLDMAKMPLMLDYFEITPPGASVKVQKAGFFEKIWVTFLNFLSSFTKNYDSVGGNEGEDGNGEKEIIDVWIARGTEWGEILKDLADESFTKETGISVNVNILPSGQLNAGNVSMLMLSITSGEAPDVALGVDYTSPAEFAFRDAVVDLTQFDNFKEVTEQFYDTMLIPYTYEGGVYALPETMNFTVLIYRKDIIQELELTIPQTWDDLYQTTLPKLFENNMSFSFPVDSSAASNSPSSLRGMTMLLAQNGGSYYSADGKYSALDSAQAFNAFKQWTELYTNYGLDAESEFFSHMRTGSMPIGVGDYGTYMKFLNAAPELFGRWGIAPMLGTRREDGSIDRSVGGISTTAGVIMEQSEKKEAAWKFLSWWMSTDTQIQFGREVEAILGTEARWNTANVEAFESLPWDQDDLAIIREQMSLAQEQPIVLGGYFTTRHLVNAWNRVVLSNENPRDAIEEAVKDINKELRNKHEEYGFLYDD